MRAYPLGMRQLSALRGAVRGRTVVRVAAFCLCVALVVPSSARAETRAFAIVAGNNAGARGRPPLRYAETDAGKVARTLTEVASVREDDLALVQGRSASDVHAAFRLITEKITLAHRSPELRALVYFYFSGHGDGESLEIGPNKLSFATLRALLASTGADVKIVVLDACQSGGALKTKGGAAVAPFSIRVIDSLRVSGEVTISSSAANESALESEELRGAYFTSNFLSGLRGAADASGDLQVTLAEAYRYAYERTVRATAVTSHGPQHPSFDFNLSGQGELVLAVIDQAPSRLRVFTEAQRLLVIDLERDQVVIDLPVIGGRELALPPGRYAVRAVRDGVVRVGQVVLTRDEPYALKWEGLSTQAESPVTASIKGGLDAPQRPVAERVSICVLPFLNASGQPAHDALSLALAETIATDFGQHPSIRLIERTQLELDLKELDFSATRYVDPATRAAIGQLVGAQVVVLGAFQLVGQRERVNARFVEVATGEVLVALKAERPKGHSLELQDAIAQSVKQSVPEVLRLLRERRPP